LFYWIRLCAANIFLLGTIFPVLPAMRMAEEICLTLLLRLFSFKGLLVHASPTTSSATWGGKSLSKPSSISFKKGTPFPILTENASDLKVNVS
jgi:hypothetical protein